MSQSPISKALLTTIFPFLVIAVTSAVEPDPRLLRLIPPGAQIVAGLSAPSGHDHPDSYLLLTHNISMDLEDFLASSGVDNTRTMHQVIFVASGSTGNLGEHSLLISGHFDASRIFTAAVGKGATVSEFGGIQVLVMQPFERERGTFNDVRWLAVLKSNITILGTPSSVRQELGRYLAVSSADSSLVQKMARLRRDDETWCVLTDFVRNDEIRRSLDSFDPRLSDLVHDGTGFQFGIHFGGHVEFEYEITEASGTSAQAISNTLTRSLVGGNWNGLSLLPRPRMTVDSGFVHGVVKVSRARYQAWLAEVATRGRARVAALVN